MTDKKKEYKEYKERIELAKGLYKSQREEWEDRFPILKEMSDEKAIRLIAKVVKDVGERWSE